MDEANKPNQCQCVSPSEGGGKSPQGDLDSGAKARGCRGRSPQRPLLGRLPIVELNATSLAAEMTQELNRPLRYQIHLLSLPPQPNNRYHRHHYRRTKQTKNQRDRAIHCHQITHHQWP